MTPVERTRLARASVLLALLGAVGLSAERIEEETTIPPSGEALYNPAHAARLFFEGMGLPTKAAAQLDSLPDTSEVLFIATTERTRLRRQADALRSWVAEGGHLLLLARPTQPEDSDVEAWDPLLEPFDIWAYHHTDGHPTHRLEVSPPGWRADDDPLIVEADSSRCVVTLQGLDRWEGGLGPEGICPTMIQVRLGRGVVTVLGDGGWTTNSTLGDHDHATLLWSLATSWPRRSGATIVFYDKPVSLASLIWQRGWAPILSGLLLLLAWVWTASRRFGPMIPAATRHRHSLLEHVEATADFLWRQDLHRVLVEATRTALPRSGAGGGTDEAAALAQTTGLETERVRAALAGEVHHNPTAFTRAIQVLERLRRQR